MEEEEDLEEAITDTENNTKESMDIRCHTEQNVLIKRMETLVKVFDEDLQASIQQKKDLAVKSKYAEIMITTLYEELQIIRASETTEDDMKRRVDNCKQIVSDIDVQVTKKENQLVKRANFVNSYNEKVKTIHEVVENELADNKYSEYLMKLFKNRDLQSKKDKNPDDKTGGRPDAGDKKQIEETGVRPETTEDRADIQSDQDGGPQDKKSSNLKVDGLRTDMMGTVEDTKHPADIELDALTLVLGYRDKRNQIEAAIREEEQRIIVLDRELSQLKIQRSTEHSIYEDAITSLHNFKVQKMSRLNSISAVVTLFRDQIHSLESSVVAGDGTTSPTPEDTEVKKKPSGAVAPGINVLAQNGATTDAESKKKPSVHAMAAADDDEMVGEEDALLVFSEDSLKMLQRRTEELKSERAMQKNQFRYIQRTVLDLSCKHVPIQLFRSVKISAPKIFY